MTKAQRLMKDQGDSFIAVDHLMLALYEEKATADTLGGCGLQLKSVEQTIKQVRGTRQVKSKNSD
jgi:ATP-dependent Clp protease ATP-binding subunit ClpA